MTRNTPWAREPQATDPPHIVRMLVAVRAEAKLSDWELGFKDAREGQPNARMSDEYDYGFRSAKASAR